MTTQGSRTISGVVAYLRNNDDGTINLIFEDVTGDRDRNPQAWSFERPYTEREYANEDLAQLRLTPAEYQMIGENLVCRLLALDGRLDLPDDGEHSS